MNRTMEQQIWEAIFACNRAKEDLKETNPLAFERLIEARDILFSIGQTINPNEFKD